jgi:hypothetical protein
MKPITVFVLVALVALIPLAANAQGAAPQPQSNENDRVVQGVAGPAPQPNHADASDKQQTKAAQPSKKALKEAKVKPKPGFNDPN